MVEAAVTEAASGVVRLRVSEMRTKIDRLAEQMAELRGQLNSLMPCVAERPWPVAWPTAALLHDPEAAVDGPVPEENAAA
jgi:hypothetical protein